MSLVYQLPACEVIFIEESKNFKAPDNLYYNLKFGKCKDGKKKRDSYEPQTWDVIAFSYVIPSCIDDLNKPPIFYFPAIVTALGDEDNIIEIFTIKSVNIQEQKKKKDPLIVTFLINLTTNIRIWRALNVEKNLDIIKNILDAGSTAGDECGVCSYPDMLVLKHGSGIDLRTLDLNESQINAVLSSIATSTCCHKSSLRLIWGPPGTGKTKTIVTMLLVLLGMKCRTLTCAPTNIAVMQVASRLLKLVKGTIRKDQYGLGDIVLSGNEKRMKVDDHDGLFVIFLDHRVERLAECFAPLTGWRHQLNSMISLLEDPTDNYRRYLEGRKEGNEDGEDIQNLGSEDEDEPLSFLEFIRKRFSCIEKDLKNCIKNLCTHMPTSFLPAEVVVKMNRALELLISLKKSLYSDTYSNLGLKVAFDDCEDLAYKSSFSSASFIVSLSKECLQVLRLIHKEFSIPDFFEKGLIRNFCLENACHILCTASNSANLHEVKPFELVVIDEAAQLKECESAIPLELPSVRHAVLIGDELQLPAMVQSKVICSTLHFLSMIN
ncbi:hypothetical protein ACHQM5_006727 [Ranunculus cassubicifolius]